MISYQNISKNKINTNTIPFVIKKKWNKLYYQSLPFSDYIILPEVNESKAIISKIIKDNPFVEIEVRDKYEHQGFNVLQVGYKHILNLESGEEKLFNSFKKTQIQQCILKATRDGLAVEISADYEAIVKFYDLHLMTRAKLGVPIQPKKFFFHFYNEIIKNNFGFLVLVYHDSKVISAGIFAGVNKILTYKFSASHPDYLKYRPNNLMLWEGILEAKRRGFEVFDFGRTDLTTEGLRKFKQGWGTTEEPLYYSYYPKAPDVSKFEFIKDKIVAPIIRHSPKFVCRWSGELLYKYFG